MSKMIYFLSTVFLLSSTAYGGGAISGGEVSFKSLLSCQAKGIDPTFHEPVHRIAVVAEMDFHGQPSMNQPLKVLLQGAQGESLGFLQTETLPFDFNPAFLVIHRWSQVLLPAQNEVLGKLSILGSSGFLQPNSPNASFPELILSDCAYEADAF